MHPSSLHLTSTPSSASLSRKSQRRASDASSDAGSDCEAMGGAANNNNSEQRKKPKLLHCTDSASESASEAIEDEEDEAKQQDITTLASSVSTLPPITPTSSQQAAVAGGTGDMRSVLRLAARDRATRSRTMIPPSVVVPASSPRQSSASPHGLVSRAPPSSRSKPALHLTIGSPGIGAMITTPVLYSHQSNSANISTPPFSAASPMDELAGFAPRSYAPPVTLPASAMITTTPPAPSSAASSATPIASSHNQQSTIACPLCSQHFAASVIEAHASTCTGESCGDDDVQMMSITPTHRRMPSMPLTAAAASNSSTSAATVATGSLATPTAQQFATRFLHPSIPLPYFPRHHDQLKLLTYNVWFDNLCMKQRMDAIGSMIMKEQPHVVALQEVTEDSLEMFMQSEWIKYYHVSERAPAPYFTLLCTKFTPLQPRRLPFQSDMARDLVCANIEVPTSAGTKRITVATSHLESEHRRKETRRQQLDVALRFLKQSNQGTETAVYMGDMNLVGSEASEVVQKYGWIDSWLHLNSARGGDKAGVTVDSKLNGMLASKERTTKTPYQARLDRVWLRLGRGDRVTTVGSKSAASLATTPAATAAASSSSSSTVPASSSAAVPIPTPSSASASSTSTPSSEWRLVSIERIGLCSIDLARPKEYANKNYRAFDSEGATAATSTSASTTTTAATSIGSPRIQGFGLAARTAVPILLPSDHFGLLTTLQVTTTKHQLEGESE